MRISRMRCPSRFRMSSTPRVFVNGYQIGYRCYDSHSIDIIALPRHWGDGDTLSAKERIAEKAIELLATEPEGIRHSLLLERLKAALPGIPANTIRGSLVGLAEFKAAEVYRPARGLFQHAMYRDNAAAKAAEASPPA